MRVALYIRRSTVDLQPTPPQLRRRSSANTRPSTRRRSCVCTATAHRAGWGSCARKKVRVRARDDLRRLSSPASRPARLRITELKHASGPPCRVPNLFRSAGGAATQGSDRTPPEMQVYRCWEDLFSSVIYSARAPHLKEVLVPFRVESIPSSSRQSDGMQSCE